MPHLCRGRVIVGLHTYRRASRDLYALQIKLYIRVFGIHMILESREIQHTIIIIASLASLEMILCFRSCMYCKHHNIMKRRSQRSFGRPQYLIKLGRVAGGHKCFLSDSITAVASISGA